MVIAYYHIEPSDHDCDYVEITTTWSHWANGYEEKGSSVHVECRICGKALIPPENEMVNTVSDN